MTTLSVGFLCNQQSITGSQFTSSECGSIFLLLIYFTKQEKKMQLYWDKKDYGKKHI